MTFPEKLQRLFTVLDDFGTDRHGSLFRVREDAQNVSFLMRVMPVQRIDGARIDSLNRDLTPYEHLDHQHICFIRKFLEIDSGHLGILMEDHPGILLESAFSEPAAKSGVTENLLAQIGSALEYLHRHDICHGPFGLDGILSFVDASGTSFCLIDGALSDFLAGSGLLDSRSHVPSDHRGNPGNVSPICLSPETAFGGPAGYRADYFSLGAVLLRVATGSKSIHGAGSTGSDDRSTAAALSSPDDSDRRVTKHLMACIRKLMDPEPKRRPFRIADACPMMLEPEAGVSSGIAPLPGCFLNQDLPQREIRDIFTHMRDTGGRIVIVLGDSGIGKSTLIQRMENELRSGGAEIISVDSVSGTGTESGFGVLNHMLESLTCRFPKIMASLLDRMYPSDFDRNYLKMSDPVFRESVLQQSAVNLLAGMSRPARSKKTHPLVVTLKNCHFADPVFWSFFSVLSRLLSEKQSDTLPCLWMIETSQPIQAVETSSLPGRFRRVELIAGNRETVLEMIGAATGVDPVPEWVADWVLELSKGNFRDMELAVSLIRQSGMTVGVGRKRSFDDRLKTLRDRSRDLAHLTDIVIDEHLPGPVRNVMRHLCVWSGGCSLSELAVSLDVEIRDPDLAQALLSGWIKRDATDRQVVYRFRYPLFRVRLLDGLPAYQKTEICLRNTQRLDSDSDASQARIADLYFEADNRLHGCEHAMAAAVMCRDRHDLQNAIGWTLKVLQNMPERNRGKIADVSFEYARLLVAAGDFSRARIALLQAEPILESRFHQKREKADYLLLVGLTSLRLSRFSEARNALQGSMDYLPKTTAFEYRIRVLLYLSEVLNQLHEPKESVSQFNLQQKILPLAEYPFFSGRLLNMVGRAYQELQQGGNAEYYIKESIHFSDLAGDIRFTLDQMLHLGFLHERSGKHRQAGELYEKAIDQARKWGFRMILCDGLCHMANLHLLHHQLDFAHQSLREAAAVADSIESNCCVIRSRILLSSVCIQKGMLDDAERHLEKLAGAGSDQVDITLFSRMYLNRAAIAERRGQFGAMLQIYTELMGHLHRHDQAVLVAFTHLYIARAHVLGEQLQMALDAVERGRRILQDSGMMVPDCDILEATILLKQDRLEQSRELANRAFTQAIDLNLLHQQAETQHLLGLIDLRQKDFNSAKTSFQKALVLFESDHEDFEAAHVHRSLEALYRASGRNDLADQEQKMADQIFEKQSALYYLSSHYAEKMAPEPGSPSSVPGQIPIDMVTLLIQSLHYRESAFSTILQILMWNKIFTKAAAFLPVQGSRQLVAAGSSSMTADELQQARMTCQEWISKNDIRNPALLRESARSEPIPLGSGFAWCIPVSVDQIFVAMVFLASGTTVTQQQLIPYASLLNTVISAVAALGNLTLAPSAGHSEGIEAGRGFVCVSPESARIAKTLEFLATSGQPVLISGAPGTGKTFVAEYLSRSSSAGRGTPSFIQCNSLAAAATPQTIGEMIRIAADTGYTGGPFHTIVFEDIDLLNSEQQDELIRIISVDDPGETPDRSGIRYVFTTRTNIRQAVQDGFFSESLYRWMSPIQIALPDLADRKEDIPQLATIFLTEASGLIHKNFEEFNSKVIEGFLDYSWPGNIAELKHVIESAVLFGSPPEIRVEDLPKSILSSLERSGSLGPGQTILRSMEDIEAAHIRSILNGTNGNKVRACELLGISRPTLDRKLEKYGITIAKKRKS